MKAHVYILRDSNGKLYVGSTDDLVRRMIQHSSGHTQTTRNMKNVQLVLQQEYSDLLTARRIERKLKNLKRKDYLEKIVLGGYIRLK